jgi:hypothetical protein
MDFGMKQRERMFLKVSLSQIIDFYCEETMKKKWSLDEYFLDTGKGIVILELVGDKEEG